MKEYVKLYEQWVNEGGWATAKTQNTQIKPKIISDCVSKMKIISADFKAHCESTTVSLPLLQFGQPVGSGTWYEDDIESQPDKVYGDVDYLLIYPTLDLDKGNERANEIETVKLYNAQLMDFIKNKNYAFIDFDESQKISNPSSLKLVMEVKTDEGTGWIQVDLIVTHSGYKDWTYFRLTPIRNVKGFVLGNLYSSFGEALELSIQLRGVRAKFSGTQMVSYSKRAGTEERLITADVVNFMKDIVMFFIENAEKQFIDFDMSELNSWKMDSNNPSFEELCKGIKIAANTLEKLGEFGTVVKYKSAKELLDAVKAIYIQKMETAASSSKFDKAETPAAKAAADKVKNLVNEYITKAKSLL
jgi:hypothetical protein